MYLAIVEPVAFRPPGFVVHLLPFLNRIDAHFDAGGLQRALRRATGWRCRRRRAAPPGPVSHGPQSRDDPVLALAIERLSPPNDIWKLLTPESGDVALASFEIVAVNTSCPEGHPVGPSATGAGASSASKRSRLCPPEARCSAAAASGTDSMRWSMPSRSILTFGAAGLGFVASAVSELRWWRARCRVGFVGVAGLLVVRRLLLVALRSERRGLRLVQNRQVNRTGRRARRRREYPTPDLRRNWCLP